MRKPMPSMKLAQWPEIDRSLWANSQATGGPFDEAGRAAQWSPETLRMVESGYGVWLHWLEKTGQLDPVLRPVERVTKDRVMDFLQAYAPGRSMLTQAMAVRGLARLVRCTEPPDGLVWLTKLGDRMGNTRERVRPKPPRLATIRELLILGRDMFIDGAFEIESADEVQGAVMLRDGLMILLLAARPALRRRALCALRLGETIFLDDCDVRAELPRELIKTRHSVSFCYPRELYPYVKYYVEMARPVLLDNAFSRNAIDEGWFWVNRRGRRIRRDYATCRIPNLIEERLGKRVSLHLFRDCAATDLAMIDPLHAGIIKDVLQHTSLKTSYDYYIQAGSARAIKRYASVLANLRKKKR